MEIRKKLTLQFTAIVAALLLVSLLVIYFLFSSFRKEDFKDRLINKTKSIAQLITETEGVEPKLLERIEKNNPTSLPKERITAYNSRNRIIYASGDNEDKIISIAYIEQIRNEGSIYVKKNKTELFGYYYKGSRDNVVVICAASDVFGFRKLNNLKATLIVVFFVSLILVFYIGRIFAAKALKPISDVINQVNEIDITNIETRVKAGSGKDEIAILADTFNNMLERLERAFKTQKDFIANVSHELRTPLTVITGQLEVILLKKRTAHEYRKTLYSVLDDMKNLNNLTNRLLVLLRADSTLKDSEFTMVRIDDIIWKARAEVLKRNEGYNVEISFDGSIEGEHHFQISGNYELLKIVFINLMDNGCKYSFDKQVIIHLLVVDQALEIKFIDKGIGIPENEIKQILNPFYRASNVSKSTGHGIGLSLVEKIIRLHNGKLDITSILHKGTEVRLLFPICV